MRAFVLYKQPVMHTIELFRNEKSWVAKFSDPTVKELFGTDEIETAFTSNADKQTVLDKITSLNPESRVIIKDN